MNKIIKSMGKILSLLIVVNFACAAHQAKKHEGPGHHQSHHGYHHHRSNHRFQSANYWAKRFEDPARDKWQKPQAVIAKLGLSGSEYIADIGSATGYFTIRLAKTVTQGKVWGIDIEKEMVTYLEKRAEQEGIANLKSVLGTAADPKIPGKVDLIFICNTYHHIAERSAYFANLKRYLRPGGRIAIVDFKLGKLPVGPPEKHRTPPALITSELGSAGYAPILLDEDVLPHQFIVLFKAVNP